MNSQQRTDRAGPRPPMTAVLYAAKSTEDKHGSIATQLQDGRALAAREDWTVVGEFSDEAFSAYSGNRGPGLAQAKQMAIEHAPSVIVVQDLDRLARGAGDAPGAADHLGELFFALRRQRVTLWSVRTGEVDSLRAVMEGERSHSESERKSQAVTAGLKRRAERGDPVGPIPLGYAVSWSAKVEATPRANPPTSQRIVDPEGAAVVERMFSLVEQGTTPGDVSRLLNREGAVTTRGKTWTTRAVRRVLTNADYTGSGGYPALIEPERFEAVQRLLDERSTERPRGVRHPRGDFLLGGIARCATCGAAMRARRSPYNGRRTYKCSNGAEGRHLCPTPPVPALEVEGLLVRNMRHYIDDLDAFLIEQAAERQGEQRRREVAVGRLRSQALDLERVRERHLAVYRRLVADGSSTAPIALEEVQRLDAERERLQEAISDAEAVVSEHADLGDLDAARALYGELLAFVEGEIQRADPADLAVVLRRVLSEVRMGVDEHGLLHVEASLRVVEHRPQTLVKGRGPTTLPLPAFTVVPKPLPGGQCRADAQICGAVGQPHTTTTTEAR